MPIFAGKENGEKMRNLGLAVAIAILVAINACSSTENAPGNAPMMRAASAVRGYIYAADPKNSEVHVYPLTGSHQTEVGHIDRLPAAFGLATDRGGNLYVSVSGLAEVRVYAPKSTEPFLILKDRVGTDVPWGVAVSATGDVAVANNISLTPYYASHVSFFHPGATTPYATLQNATSFAECIYDAYDDAGNLYVVGRDLHGRTTLGEIVGGGSGHELRDLHVSSLSQKVGGVQIDTSDHVVVAGDTELSVFAPHSNRLLRTIPYGGGANASQALALTPPGATFYIANDSLNPSQLWEYRYPSGGRPINQIRVVPQGHPHVVEVGAIAIAPPEPP